MDLGKDSGMYSIQYRYPPIVWKNPLARFSAAALALGFITSYVKIIDMPWGGSVTLCSMLFITLIGYWYGPKVGQEMLQRLRLSENNNHPPDSKIMT